MIINDRLQEARKTMELIHLLKLIIFIRSDNLVRLGFWPTKEIYSDFLFEPEISLLKGIESILASLGVITKNANNIPQQQTTFYSKPQAETKNESGSNSDEEEKPKTPQEEYEESMNSLFISVLDFYDILFLDIEELVAGFDAKSRNKVEMTKKCLNMINFQNFLKKSGEVELYGTVVTKKKENTVNFKFFKILLYYSTGFRQFTKQVCGKLVDEIDETSQILTILVQMHREIKILKEKEIKLENGSASADPEEKEEPNKIEESAENAPEENLELRSEAPQLEENPLAKFVKVKPKTQAILFDNEQAEELGYVQKTTLNEEALDEKTRAYLEYVKRFQYEDEYDDSMNIKAQTDFDTFREEFGSGGEDNDDDLEEEDGDKEARGAEPPAKGKRKWERGSQEELDERKSDRGGRGGYSKRGRGRGDRRNNYQSKKWGNREYDRKK